VVRRIKKFKTAFLEKLENEVFLKSSFKLFFINESSIFQRNPDVLLEHCDDLIFCVWTIELLRTFTERSAT